MEINIDINDENDIYDKFDNDLLAEDLYNHIYEKVSLFPNRKDVAINVSLEYKTTKKEIERIKTTMYNKFLTKRRENEKILIGVRTKELVLTLAGCLVILIAYSTLNHNIDSFSEMLLIVGWFCIWESVYSIVFGVKRRVVAKNIKQLLKSNINVKSVKK